MTERDRAAAYETGAELGRQAWVARRQQPCWPLAAEHFKPVRNREYPHVKPDRAGGLWTSTWHERHGSDWIQWCLSEEFECDRANPVFPVWTLDPEPDARVYRVDALADLEWLITRYPHRREYPDRGWGEWLDLRPHWEQIAKDFDAVHLTQAGQCATRLASPDLYGWDCESTLWFRFAFTRVEDRGWVRCVAADPWWEEAAA